MVGKKKVYVVKLEYGNSRAKKKVRCDPNVNPVFSLTGILSLAVEVDGVPKAIVPVTELTYEDLEELAKKYGVDLNLVLAHVEEIEEEKKEERELKFGE